MRIWKFLWLLLGWYGTATAQSTFFIPFNQSQEQVLEYLHAQRNFVDGSIQRKPEMGTILAIYNPDRQIEYAFHHDRLYAITVLQHYTDRALAASRRKACLAYIKSLGIDSLRQEQIGDIECFTGITRERVLKLFVRKHSDNSYTLTMTSIQARYFKEEVGEGNFFYEIDLLNQHMVLRGGKKD